jgi:ESS family glutamate:Na+ symporter
VHRWGIPEALLAGVLGLLLGPQGVWPVLPGAVIALWEDLPLILLTLVFGSLLVGKPLPRPAGLWQPLGAQVLLSLTLAFGQYLVGGVVVLAVLQPWLGVSPVMACLIEVAYEGGHGSAAAMAPTYAALGVDGAEDLGLALATVGLLASTVVGGLLVLLARWRGWVPAVPSSAAIPSSLAGPEAQPAPAAATTEADPAPLANVLPSAAQERSASARAWAVNLALAGVAVALGWGLLEGLRAHGVATGDNEPYDGALEGDTLFEHGTARGLPHAIIELRQDLIAEPEGVAHWAGLLEEVLRPVLQREGAHMIHHHASRTARRNRG